MDPQMNPVRPSTSLAPGAAYKTAADYDAGWSGGEHRGSMSES
jgi:hypothetical protein